MKSRDHTHFKYREKGSPEDNPLRHLVNNEETPTQSNEVWPEIGARLVPGTEEHNKHLRIGAWAKQTAQDTLGDIFGDVVGASGHPSYNASAFDGNPTVGKLTQLLDVSNTVRQHNGANAGPFEKLKIACLIGQLTINLAALILGKKIPLSQMAQLLLSTLHLI